MADKNPKMPPGCGIPAFTALFAVIGGASLALIEIVKAIV